MKQILLALLLAFTTCTVVEAKNSTIATGRNSNQTEITVTEEDTTDEDSAVKEKAATITHRQDIFDSDNEGFQFLQHAQRTAVNGGIMIAIISIIAIFGLPVFILFVIFYFRYKNRKARYHLAEQAIAAGQPLPAGLVKENLQPDYRTTGIKKTFTGLGLFIFLWAMTDHFGIGTIGLLVMFMGIGQWIIGINQKKEEEKKEKEEKIEETKNTEKQTDNE